MDGPKYHQTFTTLLVAYAKAMNQVGAETLPLASFSIQ